MDIIQFPRTKYLYNSNITDSDDVILSEKESIDLFSLVMNVQEKIDGNCVGFSCIDGKLLVQNKNDKIDPVDVFFKKVYDFKHMHEQSIREICGDRYVLFGEWMFWKHTVNYTDLPSYFIANDIFDKKEGKFLSCNMVENKLEGTGIVYNAPIFSGKLESFDQLEQLICKSQYGFQLMEGLYLRFDDSSYNCARAKYVTKIFKESINEHWRKKDLVPNISRNPIEKFWSGHKLK